jgi:2-dehydro-3-deoxygalactonokinase
MIDTEDRAESVVCVDMGTTNTRVWLVQGNEVVAGAQAQIGVRDTARGLSQADLRTALKDLIGQVCLPASYPSYVVAAGMITSSLGLVELPHIEAPVGIQDLARAVEQHLFPDVTPLPIFLVPGVRTGSLHTDLKAIGSTDLVRGEETLCFGLIEMGLLKGPVTLLNLGSHWKAIRIDEHQRIASSITSLAGELLHAAQTQTILASAVPHERLTTTDKEWVEAGMMEQRRTGLGRALFCVRLLEQKRLGTSDQRFSFLAGAFVAADFDAMKIAGTLSDSSPVVITGGSGLAQVWQHGLSQASIPCSVLTEEIVQRGLLTGLRSVVHPRITRMDANPSSQSQ